MEINLNSFLLMGILNVTPDSFSDGGRFDKPEKAVEHFNYLVASGADIVELGAESTRPGAELLDEECEWKRLDKVLIAINPRRQKVLMALDTRKANIAERASHHGIRIINDTSALQDRRMAEVLAHFPSAYLVLNHNRGIPPASINPPSNPQLLREVIDFFEHKVAAAIGGGMKQNQLILDPGLGFGKGLEENIILLHTLNELKVHFQLPILVGPSRKRFVGELWGENNKDLGSVAISLMAALNGANIIRCHEPKLCQPIHNLRSMPRTNTKNE